MALWKKVKLDPHCSLYTIINSGFIKNLYVKREAIKILDENSFLSGKAFLTMNQNRESVIKKISEFGYIKGKKFFMAKTLHGKSKEIANSGKFCNPYHGQRVNLTILRKNPRDQQKANSPKDNRVKNMNR